MKKTIQMLLGSALLLLSTGISQAITLSFDPVAQIVGVGSSVDVALKISGLGNGMSPSLSTFDIDISFSPDILSLTGVLWGDPLQGDQLNLFGFFGNPRLAQITSPGVLNVFELSLDPLNDLNALQAGRFTLVTLTFDAIGRGTSPLGISINVLGDANGDPLEADVNRGRITVPEPAVLPLIGAGLMILACRRRKRDSDAS